MKFAILVVIAILSCWGVGYGIAGIALAYSVGDSIADYILVLVFAVACLMASLEQAIEA